MSDSKAPIVPDEPAPPTQSLLDYGQKNPMLPCIQILEKLIANDAWTTTQNDSDEKPDAKDTSIHSSSGDDGQQLVGPPASIPSKISYAPQLDDLSQAIITGYGLQGYIRMLNVHHARAVCDRLYSETDAALRKLWNYEGAVRFDDDPNEACVKIARIAASRRTGLNDSTVSDQASSSEGSELSYPNLLAYLSPCVPYPDLAKAISTETPIHLVHTARFVNNDSSLTDTSTVDERLDVDGLTEVLKADAEGQSGRQTVLVVAVVGSPVLGHNDYVTKLLQLRQTYGFWLHLVGYNTVALAAPKPPDQLLKVLRSADSVTLPLGRWLGLKALPVITYVNTPDYADSLNQREKFGCLPWWIVTNTLMADGIHNRISAAFRTSTGILKHLVSQPLIVLPSLGNASDLLGRIEKGAIMPPTVLTFKYVMTRPTTNTETGEATEEMVSDEYVDNLNLWLMEGLATAKPSLGLQLVDLGQCKLGAAIRYCPLEHPSSALKNTTDYVNAFGERLRSAVSILDATISARQRLESVLLGKYPELRLMQTKSWAGVGDLVYLPAMYRPASPSPTSNDSCDDDSTVPAWNEEQCRQISHFNIELVHKLRATDRAFALGASAEGVRCVRLGMLADARDLEPLVDLVVKVGQEIEESSQYVDSLAEMVRRGIEAANEGLRKENDERLMQEGVLRQVPLVGSLLNWWAPVAGNSKARGRTFDLKTGRICAADLVAKSHSSTSGTASLTPHLSAAEATNQATNSDNEPSGVEATPTSA